MADLIAQGETPSDRWRRPLPPGRSILLGRAAGNWSAPWDDRISRTHVRLVWNGEALTIEHLPDAKNPVFIRGEAVRSGVIFPGQHFVVGQTAFTLVEDRVAVAADLPEPLREQSFSSQYLRRLRFRHPDLRIENLSRLPELITSATNDRELCQRLSNVLLTGVPAADAVAIVDTQSSTPQPRSPNGDATPQDEIPRVRHWDRRTMTMGEFRPSERLIRAALERDETLLHLWQASDAPGYTISDNYDWACCLPVPGVACRGWAIYLAGRMSSPAAPGSPPSESIDFGDDLKFTEIVAASLGSLRDLAVLTRRQASLAPFFSPRVRELLAGEDPEPFLAPRETDVTVMFCDLRGFSRHSEQHAEQLLPLLHRVSEALGVMTRRILEFGGVVADFQGDSAMGFWGWPWPQEDRVRRACRAALEIRREFAAAAAQPDHPLHHFRVGIGLAGGRAVAGKIGSADQVQVTVFGPVVNLAQRLESMTRSLYAEILLDTPTANAAALQLEPEQGTTRPIAVIRPKGMSQEVGVFELLPIENRPANVAAETYDAILESFRSGHWRETKQRIEELPVEAQWGRFLVEWIERHGDVAPPDWRGVIGMDTK